MTLMDAILKLTFLMYFNCVNKIHFNHDHSAIKQTRFILFPVVCYRQNKGKKYKVGETFTKRNCSQSCRCNENGKISCWPMCPKIKCPRGMRPRGKDVAVIGKNGCSCQTQECVPDIGQCTFLPLHSCSFNYIMLC